jgi:CelD/BcsL family acetyltransferase involved in cellulose biosynthesis
MIMYIEEFTDASILHSIKEEWEKVCDSCTNCTPFQYPQWIIPWWECFGGATFKAVAIRENSQLISFIPLFIITTENEIKKCFLVGTGISDYQDIPMCTDKKEECIQMFLNYLWSIRGEWDECEFTDVSEDANLCTEIAYDYFIIQKNQNNICMSKNIVTETKMLLYQVSKKLRNNIRRFERKINAYGTVSFTEELEGNLDKAIDNLISLHSARWNSKNNPGVLSDCKVSLFHHSASKLLFKKGLLKIFTLYLNEKLLASYYVLTKDNTAYVYIGGIDPAMVDFSPGTLALYYSIRSMVESGFTCFDFLRGQEEYKRYWMPGTKINYQIKIVKKNYKLYG